METRHPPVEASRDPFADRRPRTAARRRRPSREARAAMTASSFAAALSDKAAATEAVLERLLADDAGAGELARPPRLVAAMRYAVLGGGKRLRPFLAVETARLLGRAGDGAAARRRGGRDAARLLAGPRRPALHGRRRPAPRQADGASRLRRGDRDPRRRRPADARLRGAGRSRHRRRRRRAEPSWCSASPAPPGSAAWSAARCSTSRRRAATGPPISTRRACAVCRP